ncbi:MAG: glycosyltransferase, partial [Cyclobacteriaceae bacterium]|nr:glycosyltransferase [Cyclobacteriaceae bacterium]
MNIFYIPSWYPSSSNPLTGIFFKEQAMALISQFPELKIGISTWGQNDDQLLLWAGKPLQSLSKLLFKSKPKYSLKIHNDENLTEYFTPAYTWSSKVFHGNLKQIVQSNLSNLNEFQNTYGKIDIIHAHVGFPGGYIAKQLSEIHKIPYIITEHMSPFPHEYFKNATGSLDKRLIMAYAGSSGNIAVSKDLASQMNKHGIRRITTIPNLVEESMFKSISSKQENKSFTFFALGRMVPQKGIDILLKAFSQLKNGAVLRIGGDGKYLNTYKNLTGKLQIEDKIEWLGELDRKQTLHEFQNCDAFVLPSRHESMGVVFAEAMACGKPVIGTICGGPEEFINESNGYLI